MLDVRHISDYYVLAAIRGPDFIGDEYYRMHHVKWFFTSRIRWMAGIRHGRVWPVSQHNASGIVAWLMETESLYKYAHYLDHLAWAFNSLLGEGNCYSIVLEQLLAGASVDEVRESLRGIVRYEHLLCGEVNYGWWDEEG
jgi:hypothetical protein